MPLPLFLTTKALLSFPYGLNTVCSTSSVAEYGRFLTNKVLEGGTRGSLWSTPAMTPRPRP